VSDERDTDRVSVKTYVPRYQKELWKERADDLGMAQSEFVRTMVQAGARELGLDDGQTDGDALHSDVDAGGTGGNAVSADLESRVVDELRERGVAPWDDLVESLAGDFEERLEATLESLEDAGVARYSPREGGYVLRGER